MRIAVISDIHANQAAFKAVWSDLRNQGIEHVISLGDQVGYGAEPAEVVDLLASLGVACLAGNHEAGLTGRAPLERFNPLAQKSLELTHKLLGPAALAALAGLPFSLTREGARFAHGFPPDSAFVYLTEVTNAQVRQALEGMEERLCFVGHTHRLELVELRHGKVRRWTPEEGVFQLDKNARLIVNVGAVGQPRGQGPAAGYVIWDTRDQALEVRRVGYDHQAAAARIIEQGMPPLYARLVLGQ